MNIFVSAVSNTVLFKLDIQSCDSLDTDFMIWIEIETFYHGTLINSILSWMYKMWENEYEVNTFDAASCGRSFDNWSGKQ